MLPPAHGHRQYPPPPPAPSDCRCDGVSTGCAAPRYAAGRLATFFCFLCTRVPCPLVIWVSLLFFIIPLRALCWFWVCGVCVYCSLLFASVASFCSLLCVFVTVIVVRGVVAPR